VAQLQFHSITVSLFYWQNIQMDKKNNIYTMTFK